MSSENFVKNLRDIMYEKQITQAELGRRCGVSDVAVNYWITGKKNPTMPRVQVIANALGVSMERLLAGEREVEGMNIRQASEELAKVCEQLSEEGMLKVIAYVRDILPQYKRK